MPGPGGAGPDEKRPPKERPKVQAERVERLERRKEAGREYNKERLEKLTTPEWEKPTVETGGPTGLELFNQLAAPYLEQYPNLMPYFPPFLRDEEYLAAQTPEWIETTFKRYLMGAQDRAEWAAAGKYKSTATTDTDALYFGRSPVEEAGALFGEVFGGYDDETLALMQGTLGQLLQARQNRLAAEGDYFTLAEMEEVE